MFIAEKIAYNRGQTLAKSTDKSEPNLTLSEFSQLNTFTDDVLRWQFSHGYIMNRNWNLPIGACSGTFFKD